MKAFVFLALATLLAAMAPAPAAQAQNLINVTKITSTTATGGSVLLEDSTNKVAIAYHKGSFYAKTTGLNGATALFYDNHAQRIIWRGPLSGVRVVGVAANDSLKALYIRQYLTN